MLSERFWLLAVVLIISVLQQETQGELRNRDPRLTIVNVYSGLEAVDGAGKSFDSSSSTFMDADDDSDSSDSDSSSDYDDDDDDDSYDDSDDDSDDSSDDDYSDDDDDDDDSSDDDDDDEECCKMTYSNPKFAGKQHMQNSRKHADKKKKKHKQKMFYGNGKPSTAATPVEKGPAEKGPAPYSSASKDMNWNNFKKIIGHLKMKH